MIVKKIVGYPLEINRISRGSEAVRRVREILAEVGWSEDHMYRYPHELSGSRTRTSAMPLPWSRGMSQVP